MLSSSSEPNLWFVSIECRQDLHIWDVAGFGDKLYDPYRQQIVTDAIKNSCSSMVLLLDPREGGGNVHVRPYLEAANVCTFLPFAFVAFPFTLSHGMFTHILPTSHSHPWHSLDLTLAMQISSFSAENGNVQLAR